MKNTIKLVVSDMDGTLLNDQHELAPNFFEVYQKLKNQNILFVPASGRQYYSILGYFDDLKKDIAIIAENGSYVTYKDELLFADSIDKEKVKSIILKTRELEQASIVVCGTKNAYIDSQDKDFQDFFAHFYTQNKLVTDLLEILDDDDIVKIAIYHPESSENKLFPELKDFNHDGLQVVVSGPYWLDIMNQSTNKGNALKNLQQKLNISEDETMVFGDYLNDVEMLKKAKYSYAMENAHPTVKAVAHYEAGSNNDFGVVKILETLVD